MDKRLRHLLTCAIAENDRLRREFAELRAELERLRADAERLATALLTVTNELESWNLTEGDPDSQRAIRLGKSALTTFNKAIDADREDD